MFIASIFPTFELLLFVLSGAAILSLFFVSRDKLKIQFVTLISLIILFFSSFECNNRLVGLLVCNDIKIEINNNKYKVFEKESKFVFKGKNDRPINFVEYPLGFNASLNEKVGTAAHVLAEYMKLILVPHPMAFYYGYAQVVPVGLDNIQSVISILLHIILLAVALALIRRHPIFSFGILFYLFSIAIFSNLVQPVVGMMADRFTYVATVGFCIVLAYSLLKVFKINLDKNATIEFKPAFIVLMVVILSSYSYLTIARNAQWENHLTLMRHDIKHLDKSAQAHNLLASNLMKYSFQKDYILH
jgi:hypothetical protein